MKVNIENTDDEWLRQILNDESKYWEYWLVFLGNGSQNMLSILKKRTLTSNQTDLPFPLRDVYLSSKRLLKFWYFVAPQALIPRSNMRFKEQETIL